jgi:hypothetical protein
MFTMHLVIFHLHVYYFAYTFPQNINSSTTKTSTNIDGVYMKDIQKGLMIEGVKLCGKSDYLLWLHPFIAGTSVH